MVEGSASVALLVVNKLPALQALALDYATGEEKDASHHHHHHLHHRHKHHHPHHITNHYCV